MKDSNNDEVFYTRVWYPTPNSILRVMIANELWWVRLPNNNKHFTVAGIQIERDHQFPHLKIYTFIIGGLAISFGKR